MERLKSLIPDEMKQTIGESMPDDLDKTSALLLDFLRSLPQFQQVIRELTDLELALCRKSKEAALDSKQKGNECFKSGDYAKALSFYSQALRHVPSSAADTDMNLVMTLYVNRASTLHRLGLLEECVRDCNRAIIIYPAYVKAWYRRGKANASLKNYKIARNDLEVAISIEDSLSEKSHIKGEIDILPSEFDKANVTGNDDEENEDVGSLAADSHDVILQCVSIPYKGRGMTSAKDIPSGSLIHCEKPTAAILLKRLRDSHCHFCFIEVPADVVFCPSCTIPVYCSNYCQEQAGSQQSEMIHCNYSTRKKLPADLEKHVDNVLGNSVINVGEDMHVNCISEHRHECGGPNWSAVLPSDVVLAGRVMVRSIEERRVSAHSSSPLELMHHFSQNSPLTKLETHIYAVVLLYCLHHHYHSDFLFRGSSVTQLILLLSQIKVNSMAVVHMKSLDQNDASRKPSKICALENGATSSMQQVRVGQAVYSTGSLFNHSCQPNVHAYFLSRTLYLRSTELVPAWSPLELSYGPQVGELDLLDRQKLLRDQYYFQCKCSGCSQMNLPDLVINAFQCIQPFCSGAVSRMSQYRMLDDNFVEVSGASYNYKLSLPLSRQKLEICKVAKMLLDGSRVKSYVAVNFCLNCGSYCNLESLIAVSDSSMAHIKRLNDRLPSQGGRDAFISDLLKSLKHLKSVRHPFSKIVAQAEDMVAEAFVRIGEFQLAMQHCIASLEILEKLYHKEHVVIGHELTKLASIQSSLGDCTSFLTNIKRAREIFSLHYGSHISTIFPYLKALGREVEIPASSR